MKNFNTKLIKTLGVLTLCWIVSFSAMAQTQGHIMAVSGNSTCIPVSWNNPTNAPVPYKLAGIDPDKTSNYYWYVSGDLKISSISADSLTVYVSSASANPNSRGKDFGKGRIW